MGGMINVAIRFRDGRTVCQERWTNNTPFWFKNPKMYEGDEAYLQEYIDMTRNNDYVNEYVPGRPEPLRNNEYGLIVWDYMTNTILDNNGYSHPTNFDVYTSSMHEEEVMLCAKAGRLGLQTFDEERKVFVKASELLTEEEVRKLITERRSHDWSRFAIDTSPMTYIQFPERKFKDYKTKLIELGFPMTRKAGLNATLPLLKKKRKVKLTNLEKLAKEVFQGRQVEDGFDRIFFEDLGDDDKTKYIEIAKRLQADPASLQQFQLAAVMGTALYISVV